MQLSECLFYMRPTQQFTEILMQHQNSIYQLNTQHERINSCDRCICRQNNKAARWFLLNTFSTLRANFTKYTLLV